MTESKAREILRTGGQKYILDRVGPVTVLQGNGQEILFNSPEINSSKLIICNLSSETEDKFIFIIALIPESVSEDKFLQYWEDHKDDEYWDEKKSGYEIFGMELYVYKKTGQISMAEVVN